MVRRTGGTPRFYAWLGHETGRERHSSISPVETYGQAHRKHTGSFIDKSHRRQSRKEKQGRKPYLGDTRPQRKGRESICGATAATRGCCCYVLPGRTRGKEGKTQGGARSRLSLRAQVVERSESRGLIDADLLMSVFYENGFRCSLLRGVSCNDRTPPPKGSVYEFALTGTRGIPMTTGALQTVDGYPR